jgi:hypothetical protein
LPEPEQGHYCKIASILRSDKEMKKKIHENIIYPYIFLQIRILKQNEHSLQISRKPYPSFIIIVVSMLRQTE